MFWNEFRIAIAIVFAVVAACVVIIRSRKVKQAAPPDPAKADPDFVPPAHPTLMPGNGIERLIGVDRYTAMLVIRRINYDELVTVLAGLPPERVDCFAVPLQPRYARMLLEDVELSRPPDPDKLQLARQRVETVIAELIANGEAWPADLNPDCS